MSLTWNVFSFYLFLQPAYYNLGVVYSEMMQYDMALNFYEKAALERPMYAEAYCNMGVIYKNRGDLEAAITCYERSRACTSFHWPRNFNIFSMCL